MTLKEKIIDNFRTILLAALVALMFRSCAYEPFHIPSGSMEPNLLVGDYLFVSKSSYGYSRYSFPFSPPIIKDRIFFKMPKRGDVAVFRFPPDTTIDYIKRIIGLPGDKIQVKKGVLNINGQPVDLRPLSGGRGQTFLETFPDDKNDESAHVIQEYVSHGQYDNTPVHIVPEGHFFVMGDNRDNSLDSRAMDHVGFVPFKNLVGKAKIIFFSIDTRTGRSLLNPVNLYWAIRNTRLFRIIR
ncbi:MAG: signal peptidase I [Alphaproteobacteria bacterium]